jgi:hypothetical protein
MSIMSKLLGNDSQAPISAQPADGGEDPTPPPPPPPPPLVNIPGAPPPPKLTRPSSETQPKHQAQAVEFKPTWYSFYGSLTNPSWLKEVLDLPSDPTLHNAIVVGYEILPWGPHKVLVEGEPGQVVQGVAFLVETKEYADTLEFYETGNYELGACNIIFTTSPDGEPTGREEPGRVFMYRGDSEKLRKGEFDRERCMERLRRRGIC